MQYEIWRFLREQKGVKLNSRQIAFGLKKPHKSVCNTLSRICRSKAIIIKSKNKSNPKNPTAKVYWV
jgi:hypothetical protein